jgi:hypothetical protein
MSRRSSSWIARVTLPSADTIRLRQYISQEMHYFNALVAGFGGPMRTMPETFAAMTGRLESLFGEVAASYVDVRSLKEDNLPVQFKPYADLLFKDGKSAIDTRTMLLFDIARSNASIDASVRRGLAIEMLRHAREQSAHIASPQNREDQVYKFAVETVTPLEPRNKRHLQLPKSAVNTATKDARLAIGLPYIRTPIIIPAPTTSWNYITLRDDDDGSHPGQWAIELSQESPMYLLRKTDSSHRKPKRRGGTDTKHARVITDNRTYRSR